MTGLVKLPAASAWRVGGGFGPQSPFEIGEDYDNGWAELQRLIHDVPEAGANTSSYMCRRQGGFAFARFQNGMVIDETKLMCLSAAVPGNPCDYGGKNRQHHIAD